MTYCLMHFTLSTFLKARTERTQCAHRAQLKNLRAKLSGAPRLFPSRNRGAGIKETKLDCNERLQYELTCQVTLGKSLILSASQFPSLQNGNNIYLSGLLWESSKFVVLVTVTVSKFPPRHNKLDPFQNIVSV